MAKRLKTSEDDYVETDAYAQFENEATEIRKMVQCQNRKKKSGGFQSMGLSANSFKGIMRKGYKIPTPIQRKTIPVILDGKDVVAMARTGSGKTAAFLVPMFERLKTHSPVGVRALLLSPTRELAIQTQKFTKELGRFTKLKSVVMVGGGRIDEDFAAMHENPDIIIATPGRLMQILVEMNLKLSRVEYVVFDEADRLFEMGFQQQLHEILGRLPATRQTLLFSATLPKILLEFAKAGFNNPALIRLDVDNKLSQELKMSFLLCRPDDRTALLLHLLTKIIKPSEQTVVFVATSRQVEYINMIATEAGLSCSYIYSALDQEARIINIEKFRQKRTTILIATDAVARGIDIPLLDNIINYNFPDKPKLFLHRVGRVARAGRTGAAYSIVCPEEMAYVVDLHMFLGRPIKMVQLGTAIQDEDNLCGRVPQPVIDDQNDKLKFWHQKTDIENIRKVATNAYGRYCRSRVNASSESIRRSKEIANIAVGFHPIFGVNSNELQAKYDQMLEAIKHYKPKETVVSKQQLHLASGSELKKAITTKYRPKVAAAKVVDVSLPSASGPLVVETKNVSSIEANSMDIWKADKNNDEIWGDGRDGDLTIWNTDASSFEIGAVAENKNDRPKNRLVWSRKKKKYVNEAELRKPEKKQLKLKPNLYKTWLDKNKIQDREDGEEGLRPRVFYNSKGNRRQFRYNKEKGVATPGRARTELKTKEQILKERKEKAKKQAFQTHQQAKKQKKAAAKSQR